MADYNPISDAFNSMAEDANGGYTGTSYHPSTNNVLVHDAETDAFLKWYKLLDSNLSAETKDYLVQNYWNKQSEDRAFQRDLYKSSTEYQRVVKDLSAAGLNPFLALQGLGGSSPTSGSSSVQGGLYSGKAKQSMSTAGSTVAAVVAALALIAVKLLAH